MKIKRVKILDKGKAVEIETDRKDDYKFIWLDAEDLPALADISEHL